MAEVVLLLEAYDDKAHDHLEGLGEDHSRGAQVGGALLRGHAGVAHGEDEDGVLEGEDHQAQVLQPGRICKCFK